MSELMDQAVIGMPYEMAMGSELSRRQFYSRAQSILAEAQALREEAAALRARVVVVPERMEYDTTLSGQDRRDNRRYVNGWNDALSRLNGEVVSEGLLRRACAERPATCCMDDEAAWCKDRDAALRELRALLDEGKEAES